MQITVEIPDEFAAQIQARGVTPQDYVTNWIAQQTAMSHAQESRSNRLANLEKFFEEMATYSDKVPLLPEETFARESFYLERD